MSAEPQLWMVRVNDVIEGDNCLTFFRTASSAAEAEAMVEEDWENYADELGSKEDGEYWHDNALACVCTIPASGVVWHDNTTGSMSTIRRSNKRRRLK